jgi:hypothetical protein
MSSKTGTLVTALPKETADTKTCQGICLWTIVGERWMLFGFDLPYPTSVNSDPSDWAQTSQTRGTIPHNISLDADTGHSSTVPRASSIRESYYFLRFNSLLEITHRTQESATPMIIVLLQRVQIRTSLKKRLMWGLRGSQVQFLYSLHRIWMCHLLASWCVHQLGRLTQASVSRVSTGVSVCRYDWLDHWLCVGTQYPVPLWWGWGAIHVAQSPSPLIIGGSFWHGWPPSRSNLGAHHK